jgi:hypothetical protein
MVLAGKPEESRYRFKAANVCVPSLAEKTTHRAYPSRDLGRGTTL